MKLTAEYVNVGYHASDLVKYLAKHVDKTHQSVAEIYIEILNAGAYPDYKQEDIRKVVDRLYEKNDGRDGKGVGNTTRGDRDQ